MKNKRKTIIAFLIFSIFFSTLFVPSFEGAREYFVTDTESGEVFTVKENDSEITITAGNKNTTVFIDCEITDMCCFDGIFTFLCTSRRSADDYVYNIYTYDTTTGDLASFATDCKASRDNRVFAADGMEKVYILSFNDPTVLHCYENGIKVKDIKCNSSIIQMMCVSNDSILILAVDGVYLLSDASSLCKLSSIVPASPCIYTGDGIITDSEGIKYTYNTSTFDIYQEETKTSGNHIEYNGDVQIDHRDKYVYISAGTTVTKLLDSVGFSSKKLHIEDTDGSAVTSGKLGTSMVIFADGTPYCVIVNGDLTGEGNVNSRDLGALMEHLTGENPLDSCFANAADINKDNAVTTKDLLALSRLY